MKWRRILLLSIALVSVVGVVTWTILQNSAAATEFVRNRLRDVFACDASLAATSIQLGGGRLTIEGLRLGDPTVEAGSERDLIRVAHGHIDVQIDPFGGGVMPRLVEIDGFEIEAGPTLPRLDQLLQKQSGPAATGGVPQLPAVHVHDGSARLHLCADHRPLLLQAIDVTMSPRRDDPGRLQIKGTARLAEPAAEVRLLGSVDLRSGGAQLSISTGDVTCSADVVRYLAGLAQIDPGDLEFGGDIKSLTVSCVVPPDATPARDVVVEVDALCEHVRLDTPRLPPIVRDATARLVASSADDGTLHARIEQRGDNGELTVVAGMTGLAKPGEEQVQLVATGRNVVVDEHTIAALNTFPIGRDVVAALQPTTGRGDIDLFLLNPHRRGGDAELDLSLRDVAMTFHGFRDGEQRLGFPLPLEHARGRVRLRDGVLLLDDVQAAVVEAAGGGRIQLQGRVELGRREDVRTRLDIRGDDIAFSDPLRDALATLLRGSDLYERLQPSGRANVIVNVRPTAELAGGFRVVVEPNGSTVQWRGFPYRLSDLSGQIHVRHDLARFELSGSHGSGMVDMRGSIPLSHGDAPEKPPTAPTFEALFDLSQIAVDDELRAAVQVVASDLEQPWRRANPSGRLSGLVKVTDPAGDGDLQFDIRLLLDGVDLDLPVTGWRATGLRGQAIVEGDRRQASVHFDALRGRLQHPDAQPAELALLGHIHSAGSGSEPLRDLNFVVRHLDLCDQLGDTLDELGAFDRSAWDSLAPSGQVDLVAHDRNDERGKDLKLIVYLDDVSSKAAMLPRDAEHMSGELHVHAGALTFDKVLATLGTATVQCTNGRVRIQPDTGDAEISFDVIANDFPVDDGLANLFSDPLRQAVLDRKLRGRADVTGMHLEFLVPASGQPKALTTTIAGAIELKGVNMQLGTGRDGIRVDNLQGFVNLQKSTVTERGGLLRGTLDGGSLSLFGHPFESVGAEFAADAERLTVDTLFSRIHNGEVKNATMDAAALTYVLPGAIAGEGRLSANLEFENIDVFSLLTTNGWQNPPYSGTASGHAVLRHLDGNDVVGAEADGELTIERADLGKVPLFKAIYRTLPPADQPTFNHLELAYNLTGGALNFSRLLVRSDILEATGKGKLDLDGYVDIEMKLDSLLGRSADPLVMPLLMALARPLVSFRLFGHLRNLSNATEVIGEGSPRRRQVLPMPPSRPQPTPPRY